MGKRLCLYLDIRLCNSRIPKILRSNSFEKSLIVSIDNKPTKHYQNQYRCDGKHRVANRKTNISTKDNKLGKIRIRFIVLLLSGLLLESN